MKKLALCTALCAALPAAAVTLAEDGMGQALIYPYYTVQSTGSDAFNTYISVVSHASDAKAVRVRFREGRMGKAALDFNLYLSPNDVWTAAVVPTSSGARLVTTDRSCTEPAFGAAFGDLTLAAADDGAGAGLDRTREGFVEILEMATLTGASASAVTHNSAGVPSNCAAILSSTPLVGPPSGGLSGTFTLINVANGMDFGGNAEALDELATRPFFRPASDPYPDFNAAEIDAVSVVTANGATYRSAWTRPVDAVSAVLMRRRAMVEYILDSSTASATDVVMTFPTRHFYVTPSSASAPFAAAGNWASNCVSSATARFGELLAVTFFNREERTTANSGVDFPERPPDPPRAAVCASTAVSTIRNIALVQTPRDVGPTPVLGSVTGGLVGEGIAPGPAIFVTPSSTFTNGWLALVPGGVREVDSLVHPPSLGSGGASTRIDHATGQSLNGPQGLMGLPMVGFGARIFRNGTLRCDAGACQGNYGGSFPLSYTRSIAP